MDAGSLIEALWTRGRFEDFMAQTTEKFSKRFPKLFVAIDDQNFLSRVPHGREYEHKRCQPLQRQYAGIFSRIENILRYFSERKMTVILS
jgi:hypothetical protein